MPDFQTAVGYQPAPAVEGDFCSHNPRQVVNAGPGGLVAGSLGVTIARFAWRSAQALDADGAPAIVNSFGSGPVVGFVHREQQASILAFLGTAASASMTILPGSPVTLFSGGDFWVKNNGTTPAQVGQKAYANVSDGSVAFAATGAAPGAGSVTAAVAASTGSFTGSINGNILTVTAVGSGVAVAGGSISGTNVASGTKIVGQLSGTTGGIGTYAVSIPNQTVASTTISETYGTMTVTAVGSGAVNVGSVLSGSGVVAGTSVTQRLTGAGGTGTYVVSDNTVVASTTVAATLYVETKWFAESAGIVGEIVKMTNHLLG